MRITAALSSLALAFLAVSPAPAQTTPEGAALASACGGEVSPEAAARMPKAQLREKLTCFTRVAADNFNKTLPKKIDDATVLQRVSAEGTTLTYHYSVNILKAELRPGAMEAFYPNVRQNVCGAADMRAVIGYGGSYRYRWYDRNAELMGEYLITAC